MQPKVRSAILHVSGESTKTRAVRATLAFGYSRSSFELSSRVRRGPTSSLRVLALAALVLSLTSAAAAQSAISAPQVSAPATASEPALPDDDTSHCQAIAAEHPEMTPLVAACRFALTFRRQLPDFVCEQTTTSTHRQTTGVMNAEVTFENGHERYSNVTIDTKAPSAEAGRTMKFISAGEMGSDLVDLFKAPLAAEFKFHKEERLNKTPASVYEFRIAAEKNTFWALRDNRGVTLHPEYQGELWLERETGRILRLKLRPVRMPVNFDFASVAITTDYNNILIADVGTFLLPSKSATTVCFHNSKPAGVSCRENTLLFHDCRKFGTKTRIVTDLPQH
jgi:hypothetical protein